MSTRTSMKKNPKSRMTDTAGEEAEEDEEDKDLVLTDGIRTNMLYELMLYSVKDSNKGQSCVACYDRKRIPVNTPISGLDECDRDA